MIMFLFRLLYIGMVVNFFNVYFLLPKIVVMIIILKMDIILFNMLT